MFLRKFEDFFLHLFYDCCELVQFSNLLSEIPFPNLDPGFRILNLLK